MRSYANASMFQTHGFLGVIGRSARGSWERSKKIRNISERPLSACTNTQITGGAKMRDDDILWGKQPRGRRVEPVSFEGDPPGLRKHEQGVIHTLGLVAMCTPFVFFALHVERPAPDQKPAGPPARPAVAAKAVPSTPVSAERAVDDEQPSYFDENSASRVVLRRILFVPADDDENSEKMDVLYDVDTEKRTVQIEKGEAIRGSSRPR